MMFGFLGASIFVVGSILLGALSGGATLMGTLASFGGGSLITGGAGVKGGALVIAILGLSSGIMVSNYTDSGCVNETYDLLRYQINGEHTDSYYYSNGKVAFTGMFKNNIPNGNCVVYDEFGQKIYSGLFVDGFPRICKMGH